MWRSYLALKQMSEDEEYSELAEPRKYSYFEEVFKRNNVRDWLGWSDNEKRFTNEERVREFYSWMLGELDEEGERTDPRLPEAKSVRDFSRFVDDEAAMQIFRGPGGSLARALARYEAEHPEAWQGSIEAAESTVASLGRPRFTRTIARPNSPCVGGPQAPAGRLDG